MKLQLPFILARRFVAAETLEETLPVIDAFNERGIAVAIDRLGEYTSNRDHAEAARDAYIHLARTIGRRNHDGEHRTNISIKLSAMGQKIDHAFCLTNLRKLLETAAENDVFIRLDMEGSDVTASTLSIFEQVYPSFPGHVGPVLQAYLHRTARDVDRMCELGVRVRLCKGAYREPASIAYQSMEQIRDRFVDYMERLVRQSPYPGIATHDQRLIEATKRFTGDAGIPADRFEFQMLYGIRPAEQEALVSEGYHVRVYVPYGNEWLPYFTRRLRERKENVWFVLRHLFAR